MWAKTNQTMGQEIKMAESPETFNKENISDLEVISIYNGIIEASTAQGNTIQLIKENKWR